MSRGSTKARAAAVAASGAVLFAAVAALAGLGFAAPPPGKGAGAAQYQYGPAGDQYGGHKVLVCHKGRKTISVGKPAVKAHLRHGDKLGPCS